jgi:hypothetical protein
MGKQMHPYDLARNKYEEAMYFLRQMEANINSEQVYKYNVSAFLSAARSVMQIIYEDYVKGNSSIQTWYDDQIKDPLLGFMRDLRNKSIHRGQYQLDKPTGTTYVSEITENIQTFVAHIPDLNISQEEFLSRHTDFSGSQFEFFSQLIWSFIDFPGQISYRNDAMLICTKIAERLDLFLSEFYSIFLGTKSS